MPTCRVLFVCLGNICRSPTAQGVFHKAVKSRGLAPQFDIDSAGTSDWNLGSSPDQRAQRAALKRGIDLSGLRARQVNAADMADFDYIIAMDYTNYDDLLQLAGAKYQHKIHLFLAWSEGLKQKEIPDPYHGDVADYEHALDLIERASDDWLTYLLQQQKRVSSKQA